MVTFREMKIQEIVDDKTLAPDKKIEELKEIEAEVRALQRAATESPMNPNDGWDNELREVRKALDRLGDVEAKKGAASL